eukprot:765640-Hanusia_phi.AAC.3
MSAAYRDASTLRHRQRVASESQCRSPGGADVGPEHEDRHEGDLRASQGALHGYEPHLSEDCEDDVIADGKELGWCQGSWRPAGQT